jgi:hypothetical protein
VPQSPQAVAERVVRAWHTDQDLNVEPGHCAALIIPSAVVAELGLDEASFDDVAQLWDEALLAALGDMITKARQRVPNLGGVR